jgi:C1A family cysteine protease
MMADNTRSVSNEITGLSAFGGHLLAPADSAKDAAAAQVPLTSLAALGIEDAEQLVAVAAIPEVLQELQSALGGEAREFEQLLDDAKATLPPDRVTLLSSPAPRDLGLGVIEPTSEMIAAAEGTAAEIAEAPSVALPPAVNLISYMSPIRNQGPRGTCVAYACSALNEYILRRRGNPQDLSEQHLYYETKQIDGSPNACGTWQAKAVVVLRDRGQCREVVWPYNPNPPCNNHGALPPQARPDALAYRLATLAVSTRNVLEYKTHMSKQRPVTLSIPVYNSWYQSAETRRSGRITMRIGNEASVGGHAVCLVGYQDQATSPGGGYFIVRNSWGTTGWAYQSPYGGGYGTIPYQYITNDAWESFTAVVPGIGEEENGEIHELTTGSSSVVIEVGSNIKVRISAG